MQQSTKTTPCGLRVEYLANGMALCRSMASGLQWTVLHEQADQAFLSGDYARLWTLGGYDRKAV